MLIVALFILCISALVLMVLSSAQGLRRTKNIAKWLKGYQFDRAVDDQEVVSIIRKIDHPDIISVEERQDGLFIKMKDYEFKVNNKSDKSGNSIVSFTTSLFLSRRKSKMALSTMAELYLWMQSVVENRSADEAMALWESNQKSYKQVKIAMIVFVVAIILTYIVYGLV
mgnify:CR=1 FL=1